MNTIRGHKKRGNGMSSSRRRAHRRAGSARARRSGEVPERERADEVWTAITAYLDTIFLPGEG